MEEDQAELRPPAFLDDPGFPWFTEEAWVSLAELRHQVPTMEEIPPLDSRAAVRIVQSRAPGKVLGSPPDIPSLNRAAILAVSDGDVAEMASDVDRMATELFHDPGPVEPVDGEGLVEFYLEGSKHPTWAAMTSLEGRTHLLLEGRIAIARALPDDETG